MKLIIILIILVIILAVLYNLYRPQQIEIIETDNYLNKMGDPFEDGLDHPYGLKKQHRHHSF